MMDTVFISVDFFHYRITGRKLSIEEALPAFKEDLEHYLFGTTYHKHVHFKDAPVAETVAHVDIELYLRNENVLAVTVYKNAATQQALYEAACHIFNIFDKYSKFKYLCFQKEKVRQLVIYKGITSVV